MVLVAPHCHLLLLWACLSSDPWRIKGVKNYCACKTSAPKIWQGSELPLCLLYISFFLLLTTSRLESCPISAQSFHLYSNQCSHANQTSLLIKYHGERLLWCCQKQLHKRLYHLKAFRRHCGIAKETWIGWLSCLETKFPFIYSLHPDKRITEKKKKESSQARYFSKITAIPIRIWNPNERDGEKIPHLFQTRNFPLKIHSLWETPHKYIN